MKRKWCLPFFHGELIGGLGGMGDAIICLRCGREKYEEHWNPIEVARARDVTEEDWPRIEAARALPGGLDTLVMEDDPEFEAWLRSKNDVFNPDYRASSSPVEQGSDFRDAILSAISGMLLDESRSVDAKLEDLRDGVRFLQDAIAAYGGSDS